MNVAEIMNADALSVQPHTPVEDVLRVMAEHDPPALPVVNDGGRPVGIITEADLVLSGEDADLHLPHYVQLFGGFVFLESLGRFEERLRKAAAAKARDLMTEDPVTVDVTTSARQAAKVIADTGHNSLPVVEHGRLVGLVTRADVLQALTRE